MRRRICGLAAVILLLAVFSPAGARAAPTKARRTVDVGIQHVDPNKVAELKLNRREASQGDPSGVHGDVRCSDGGVRRR